MSHVHRLRVFELQCTSTFPKRSNDLQISFKFSIILFWMGQWSSCLNSFGEPKGKIGHYRGAQKIRFPYISLSIAFLLQSWVRVYRPWRRGKKDHFVSMAGCQYFTGINGISYPIFAKIKSVQVRNPAKLPISLCTGFQPLLGWVWLCC